MPQTLKGGRQKAEREFIFPTPLFLPAPLSEIFFKKGSCQFQYTLPQKYSAFAWYFCSRLVIHVIISKILIGIYMIVYHGSANELVGGVLKPRQARTYDGSNVPESELREAIYVTPDLGYAIAMAARPEGRTDIDELNHKITFENPERFNPEKDIYIYELDTENLPEGAVENVDEWQIALHIIEGIKPLGVRKLKAKEVIKYYELTNYKRKEETQRDWLLGSHR